MEYLKEEYEKTIRKQKEIAMQLESLEQEEVVKQYRETLSQYERIKKEKDEAFTRMKYREYASCNHISVITYIERDDWEGRAYYYHGCIKCGLDRKILAQSDNGRDVKWMPLSQQVMYNFLKKHGYHSEINTNIRCDLTLAMPIYQKIKEENPSIDDETAKKYFEAIMSIKQEEQQAKSPKQLKK